MRNTILTTILALALTLAVSGCNEQGSVTNASSSTSENVSSGTTTANTCSSPTTSAIWKGERSTATTVALRGSWSDMGIIPSTTYPASAYVDAGCNCIRYTYWDGTQWQNEVIAAATANTAFVRLAFLSTGIPIVVWSNTGAYVQMAIRSSASTTSEGTWALTTLDSSGTASRAVEIKVNPADQVAILFARNTAGSAHLILCTSGCSSGSNYSAASSTLGTVGTTPYSLGLGWCSTGSAYYPVVALSGGTNSGFAICRQGTLSSCLSGIASWTGGALTTLTGSGANRVTTQLVMDDTTTDAPIRAVINNGSAISYYQSSFTGGGCASGTVAAIAAGGTISGTAATSGNAYIEVKKAGSNYHMIANEGTATVRYYNTTSGSFTSWNASGTVATVTLPAAGSIRGGLAVDSSLSQAYTTYIRTAAVTPFPGNLTFGWVENTTVASNNASAEFYELPMTTDGQMQLATNQVPNVATAATSSGTPGVAFVDYSINSATTGVLKYAYRMGSTASSSWSVRTIPVVAQPQNVALVYDTSNKPWIAYYDQQTLRFVLTTNSQTDGTGTWSNYYFPFRTAVTAATAPAYHSVALALDRSASPVRIVMIAGVANHGTVSNTGVWAARLNPSTGDWANVTQIVSTNAANSVSNVTADFDTNGNIVVAYYNRGTNNRVEYSQSVDGGVNWSTVTNVTSLTAMGAGANIKINPSTTRPAITYYDRSNNRVYYSYCTSAIASCSSSGNWSYSFVENLTAGVSGLASTNEGLLSTALSFTSTGSPYVIYPIASGNTGLLAFNSSTSSTFPLSSTLVSGKGSDLTTNPALAAVNFAQPGWSVDSVRASTGSLHSAYIGAGNWLYVTSCGD